ncbi:unnamed protein product [Anisakis simplex]|uniref:BSD domain-containing protein n=1 Tax=Anisakis simplex TaxID=6269 RepID=A0A0M3IZC0_ANISI|nr:unnamed protein product [Anisakis simplex]
MSTETCGLLSMIEETKETVLKLSSLRENLDAAFVQTVNAPPQITNEPAQPVSMIKLPRIDLPTFWGDTANWFEFWAVFESAIHNQPLSEVQKLTSTSA